MRIIFINRSYLYILLLFVLVLTLPSIIVGKKTSLVSSNLTGGKIIGIDPGHGGIDPGAIGVSGTEEDEINLAIGLKLKQFIEQNGEKAVITRDSKDGLYTRKSKSLKEKKTEDLHKRKEIIEGAGCHVFVSIHLNSFRESKYYGAQTFYKAGDESSSLLAACIQNELRDVLDKDNHRQAQERDDVFLINEMEMPSVLIECGFLSNPREDQLLNSTKYQDRIAWAIYIGIMKYFNESGGEYNF